tara:strand:- start:219 stop:500 length:282 start_codon:yes stop_codon:yes gene_type:complete
VLNELGVDLNQNGQTNKNLKKGKDAAKVDSLSLIVEKQDEEQSENSTNSGDQVVKVRKSEAPKDEDVDSESEIGAQHSQRQGQTLSTPNPDDD